MSEAEEIKAIPSHPVLFRFSVDGIDIDAPVSILRKLEDGMHAKLAFVELSLSLRPPSPEKHSTGLAASLDITLMDNCTKQDFQNVGLGIECGGIKVTFDIAHEPESEYNVSGSKEDE